MTSVALKRLAAACDAMQCLPGVCLLAECGKSSESFEQKMQPMSSTSSRINDDTIIGVINP